MNICFNSEEISEFLLHENAVPDALLPKAWFISETATAFSDIIYHIRQRVIHNNVRPDKTYTVKIMLKDSRKIKQFQQYTYELIFYDGPVVRARVHSTFVQEAHDEN